MKAQKYFETKFNLVNSAKTVNELIESMSYDVYNNIKDSYKAELRKTANKTFKGNFAKFKAYCLNRCNTFENNYFSE